LYSFLYSKLEEQKKKTNKKNNTNNNNNNNVIINDVPQDGVLAESAYCQHFKDSKIYLDVNKLKELDNNQYINEEFTTNSEAFSDGTKLDYYIRYSLISRGICYYDEENVQEINKFDKFQINLRELNIDQDPYMDVVRYDKTFNCYYYYNKYIHQDSLPELRKHDIAINHLSQYMYAIYFFVYNKDLCPDPKENMKGKFDSVADETIRATEYYNQRVDYITEINNFYQYLNITYHNDYPTEQQFMEYETNLEHDTRNLELTLCGYPTQQQKNEYCKTHHDICCYLKHYQEPYLYKFYKEPIYYGVAVASILIIVGSFFSSKIIKEIQMQENIKKSILNQEKEYQAINKQNLQNAYKEGFDPKAQTFNSNSRNLNGTLRPGKNGTMGGSELTMGMNSNSRLGTMGNTSVTLRSGGGSLGRYPPNSFNVTEDYKSSDSRDISLRRGMIVQLVQKFEGGWVMVKDIQTNRQGYAPEYCLGNKMS